MKKVCVVTTTRAEYGLLRRVIQRIDEDTSLKLCLFVSGTHLLSEYGMTVNEIIDDGFPIAERIDYLQQSDSTVGITKSIGMATILFAEAFEKHKPDMIILLGDRYELLAIASCAMIARIPIAHISGGEVTEGAIDDCVRHCLTKLSFLHFPGCEAYRKRIIQLGESPERVFNFGDVGLENIMKMDYMTKEELSKSLGFDLSKPYICATYHPETLSPELTEKAIGEILKAVNAFSEINFIFTKANADLGGTIVNNRIEEFAKEHDHCVLFSSLGIQRYLSCLKYAEAVFGNSSSGIVEAPSFGIPTINIGERQQGRLLASSIINCETDSRDITKAIQKALSAEFRETAKHTVNPYGVGDTSEKIVAVIKDYLNHNNISLKKKFYDIDFEVKE